MAQHCNMHSHSLCGVCDNCRLKSGCHNHKNNKDHINTHYAETEAHINGLESQVLWWPPYISEILLVWMPHSVGDVSVNFLYILSHILGSGGVQKGAGHFHVKGAFALPLQLPYVNAFNVEDNSEEKCHRQCSQYKFYVHFGNQYNMKPFLCEKHN